MHSLEHNMPFNKEHHSPHIFSSHTRGEWKPDHVADPQDLFTTPEWPDLSIYKIVSSSLYELLCSTLQAPQPRSPKHITEHKTRLSNTSRHFNVIDW